MDMGLTWQPWTSVSQGSTTPGAPLAALPWQDSFALFISDPNGGIYAIKATPGYGWEPVPGLTSKPGGQITARLSGSLITLFTTDANGEVFTTTGAPYQGWQPWTTVSEGGTLPGASIAAIAWDESFALFLTDPNGGIYAIKAIPGYGWEPVPGLSSKPGTPIAALLAGSLFTLFTTDVNGEVFTTSGAPYQSWQPWTSVSQGSTTPGASIAAATPWDNSFALILSDPCGDIYAIKATPGYGWEPVPGLSCKPGGQITVVPWNRPPTSSGSVWADPQMLLFMVDVNGEVSFTSGLPYQSWDPWTTVPGISAVSGASVAASRPIAPDLTNGYPFSIFVADSGGEVFETTTSSPPPAPTDLAVTGVTAQSIVLSWDESNPAQVEVDGFAASIYPDNVTGGSRYYAGPTDRTLSITNLASGAQYTIDISAFNANGYSPLSAPVRATTLDSLPAAPTGIRATVSAQDATSSLISLEWTDNSDNETGFRISFTAIAGAGAVLSQAEVAANVVHYSFATANNGTTYSVNVQAFNNAGASPASAAVEFTLPAATTPPASAASVSAFVTETTEVGVYTLAISGSNFGKSEQVEVEIDWIVSGEGAGNPYALPPVMTDPLVGSFKTTFLGNSTGGLCPVEEPFGIPQPLQTFKVVAKGLTSNKTASTTTTYTCPFSTNALAAQETS